VALMAGVVLVAVSSALPALAQVAPAGVRDLAFAGMGTSLLLAGRRRSLPRVQDTTIERDEAVSAYTVRM
jgi:hypothetical protein